MTRDERLHGPLPTRILRRIQQGELGSLRVLLGIALIWTIFQLANDRFLSAVNLTNLLLQISAVGTISVGVVLVLLLGEIDLSVGAVSGLAAGVTGVLSVNHGWSATPALLAGLGVGAAIGALNGFMVTFFGIPSFVVTLAGSLIWLGGLLWVLGDTGTLNLTDPTITGLTNTFSSNTVGWAIAAVVIAGTVAAGLVRRRRRLAAGLAAERPALLALRLSAVSGCVIAGVAVVNADRGLPRGVLIFVGLVAVFSFLTTRTRWGRHVYAVGGNAEASRRAGIRVSAILMSVFILTSTLAAAGGILASSRLLAVNQSSGGGDVLLLSIAGPVIAGTSLFGGRGSVWHALLGALVIGSVSNGMDLLALDSSVKYMVTGGVLLAAVTIEAATRSRRRMAGRV